MSSMTFYTNPQSRGRIVRWMLEEIGQPYEVQVLEFGGNIKAPAYLAINPMGKVPALVHEGTVITEVAGICTWLAERFPDAGLAPTLGSPARGVYYRWLFFIAGPLEMATTAKAFQWRIDADNAQSVGCGMIADTLTTIEQAIAAGPWLCGTQFTTADLLLSSYLGWEMMTGNLEAKPLFKDYVARAETREAARRAAALDDALMPAPV